MGENMKLKNKMNKQYTQISIYVILTAIIIYCLSLVAKSAPSIFDNLMEKLYWFLKVIKPIILGFVFAYLVQPITNFFDEKFRKLKIFKKKQASCKLYAVITTLIILLLIITSIISLLVFSITDQLRLANFDDIIVIANGYMKIFDDFYYMISQKLSSLDIQSVQLQEYVKNASTFILEILQSFANNAVGSITNISSYLTTFLFSLVIGIYFLLDGKMICSYISKVSYALFSEKFNNWMKRLLNDADEAFSGYIRGQLTDAFVMLVLISLSLSIIGIKFGLLIGVMAGIGNLIPYCGPFVAYAGTILVSIINGDYKKMIIAIIVLFIIQTIDGNIIGPKLLSKSIQIHPLLIIIFIIFGSAIGGLLGMLLAVPVGAFVKTLFVKFIDYRVQIKDAKKQEKKK